MNALKIVFGAAVALNAPFRKEPAWNPTQADVSAPLTIDESPVTIWTDGKVQPLSTSLGSPFETRDAASEQHGTSASNVLPFLTHQVRYPTCTAPADSSNAAFLATLTERDVADLRAATGGITICAVNEISDPTMARFLRTSAIDPIIRRIQTDPQKSNFQNEDVTKLTSTSGSQPFSNFAMHLTAGGQDGVHAHPFGPRNLVVMSDGPWSLLCGRAAQPGEDLADIKRIARVRLGAGQYVVSLPANRIHGFESEGDGTVAYSMHAFDEEEVRAAGISDSKDVMAMLTRDLGSEGLRTIGDVDVTFSLIGELHARGAA